MRKLESNERYLVAGMWDGFAESEYFTNKEKACEYAKKLVRDVRWTKNEMNRYRKNNENYVDVSIALVDIDEDGDIEWLEDRGSVASFEVNEKTVDRLY